MMPTSEKPQRITVKDVARQAGVSPSTVSRVVNRTGYVSDEIRARVEEAIRLLRYRPNGMARSLRQNHSHMIGVVFPDIANPFFMQVGRGLEERLAPFEYLLIFGSSGEREEEELRYVRAMVQQQVDGLVLASCSPDGTRLRQEIPPDMPLVLIDRRVTPSFADLVVEDDRRGAELATNYLLDHGHTKIAVITGPRGISTAHERVQGFLAAMSARGLRVPDEWIVWSNFRVNGGYEAAERLLTAQERPTALFVANNLLAAGVMLWLREHSWRVPDEVSVVSFGDFQFAELATPPLTVVQQSAKEMGAAAADLLLRRLRAPGERVPYREVVFIPDILERASVKPPPDA